MESLLIEALSGSAETPPVSASDQNAYARHHQCGGTHHRRCTAGVILMAEVFEEEKGISAAESDPNSRRPRIGTIKSAPATGWSDRGVQADDLPRDNSRSPLTVKSSSKTGTRGAELWAAVTMKAPPGRTNAVVQQILIIISFQLSFRISE